VRALILAPIDNSPFGLAVAELCRREPGVDVAGVVVRTPWTFARMSGELRRDGPRLLRKAWRKLVLEQPQDSTGERSFYDVVRELGVERRSLAAWARQHGVPLRVVSDHNDAACLAFLREVRPQIVPFTGGGLIRKALIEAAGLGILNAHMGLLPEYRGMDVVEWPLLEGRHESIGLGVTLHLMDPGVDTGPIVERFPIRLAPGDSMERLRTRFEPTMVEALVEGVRRARDGRLGAKPQLPSEGRQHFALHPRLYAAARARLARTGER
jgi:folate-dependent phosphoribosylglycinamide formyltransferase PurN